MTAYQRLKSVALAVLICFGLVWTADRDPPQDYIGAIPVSSGYTADGRPIGPATPGGALAVRYQFNRERLCSLMVHRSFVDSQGFLHILKPEPYNPTATGEFTVSRWIEIDPKAYTGPAVAKIDVMAYCNPLQWILNWPIQTTLAVHFSITAAR